MDGAGLGGRMMTKWILKHAIHRGTLTSRDTAQPEEFDTEKEALKAFYEHRALYHRIGYQIWYARLASPDGIERVLEQNPYQ